jgi:hypothetical protein
LGDWRRLTTDFQFEKRFGLSERESEIIFHACSSSEDASSEAALSLGEFCLCLVQVAHLTCIAPRPQDAASASKQDKSRALGAICHFLQNPEVPFERDAAMALHVAQVGTAAAAAAASAAAAAAATAVPNLTLTHSSALPLTTVGSRKTWPAQPAAMRCLRITACG